MLVKDIYYYNMTELFNIGFTQKTAELFFETLRSNKIECLIDVRLNPNGQLSRFAFEKDLPYLLSRLVDGCAYAHEVRLAPAKYLLKEVRDKGSLMGRDYTIFEQAYREQIHSTESVLEDFVAAFSRYKRIALLCSEPTVCKCHRRLISEMLLERFGDKFMFGGNL